MAAARTLAFAANRYADRSYDARNPRTADRPIPAEDAFPGQGGPTLLVITGLTEEWDQSAVDRFVASIR